MSAADIAKALEALVGGSDEDTTVNQFLNTGYEPLNYALSARYDGGMPCGRIAEVYGPPSSGKTAIATEVMAAAQRMGGFAAFNDHERSFSMALAPRLNLDVSPGKFLFKKPRTFEDSITLCLRVVEHIRKKELIASTAPIAWVFDSLASMVPQSKLFDNKGKERELDSYSMHDNTALARATSACFPAFAQICEELNVFAMFLNQMRTKPGVTYGDPTTTPGGDAPKFYASVRVQLGGRRMTKGEGEAAEVIGNEVGCKVVKNKIARPFRKAKWRFMFLPDGSGRFDSTGSLIQFLIENKCLEASSGRIAWDGKTYYAEALRDKIDKEGTRDELVKLLPKVEDPAVVVPEGLPELGAEAA